MDINKRNLDLFFKALSGKFRAGLGVADTVDLSSFVEEIPNVTDETDFSWLGEAEDLRLWEGGRVLTELASYTYAIRNKEYERTLRAKRRDLENDHTGLYGTRAEKLGRAAKRWKMLRKIEALTLGGVTNCYDGQYFFDTDHPVGTGVFSNFRTGAKDLTPFYVFDTSHVLKPIIFQSEGDPKFEALTNPDTSDHVFMYAEFLFGVRAYGGAGYGFPQHAFKSGNDFSEAEFKTIRNLMEGYRNDQGQLLGSSPTLIVYGQGQRDLVEAVLLTAELVTTANGNAGSAVHVRTPTVFSGVQALYIPFLP